MKKLSWFFVAGLALFAVSAKAIEVYPNSDWEQQKEKRIGLFKPAAYLMFGFDYRTDDHARLYISPGFIADILLQLNPVVGLKSGIGYNAMTKYSGIDGVRTYSADAALHLEAPTGGVQPYLEGGFRYMKYEETGQGAYRREGKTGLFAGLGLSIFLTNSSRIDLGLDALLNNFENADYEGVLPNNIGPNNTEWPIDGTIGGHKFASQLYNPLVLEIEMRLKL